MLLCKSIIRQITSITTGEIPTIAKSIQNGDRHVLSRAITLLESRLPTDQLLVSDLFSALAKNNPRNSAIRLGFSGAPGVGKSTLIERFGMFLVSNQKKNLAVLVSVLAGIDYRQWIHLQCGQVVQSLAIKLECPICHLRNALIFDHRQIKAILVESLLPLSTRSVSVNVYFVNIILIR
jgi:hypothetical protein